MKKHSHYFKDVSNLTEIDVYEVCKLFNIKDSSGATQHAIKKLLLMGGRGGGKSAEKDLQEAIDTLTRLQGIKSCAEVQGEVPPNEDENLTIEISAFGKDSFSVPAHTSRKIGG